VDSRVLRNLSDQLAAIGNAVHDQFFSLAGEVNRRVIATTRPLRSLSADSRPSGLRPSRARSLTESVEYLGNMMAGDLRRTGRDMDAAIHTVRAEVVELLEQILETPTQIEAIRRHVRGSGVSTAELGNVVNQVLDDITTPNFDAAADGLDDEAFLASVEAAAATLDTLRAAYPDERFKLAVGAVFLPGGRVLKRHAFVTQHSVLGRSPTVIDALAGAIPGLRVHYRVTAYDLHELARRQRVYTIYRHYDEAPSVTTEGTLVSPTETSPARAAVITDLREFADDFRERVSVGWGPDVGAYSTRVIRGRRLSDNPPPPPSTGQCVPTSWVLVQELRAQFPDLEFLVNVGAVWATDRSALVSHTYVTCYPESNRPPIVVDATPDQSVHIDDVVIVEDMGELGERGLQYITFNQYDAMPEAMREDLVAGSLPERVATLAARMAEGDRRRERS
jgi:hypothetical protein